MSLDVTTILDGLVSHALSIGYFERVNTHEPKSHPGHGLSCAIWVQEIRPLPLASGLNETTVLLAFDVRVYSNMLQDPQDAIDPNLLTAVDALMSAYSGNFTLGGAVRDVDLLGQFGSGLTAEAGYVNINQKLMRVMTIGLPLVVNDLWSQAA